MPQGETIQIPLTRNIGRQNQMHLVCHFSNARSDLGRKGFQREFTEFAEGIATKLIQNSLGRYAKYLKPTSGASASLARQQRVDDWKQQFGYEAEHPLVVRNPLFFRPKDSVSVLSVPTREQDVIALFNQFLAGGVIRGIDLLSTNEQFTYDSMFRVITSNEAGVFVYDRAYNPLGLHNDNFVPSFRSSPKILSTSFHLMR